MQNLFRPIYLYLFDINWIELKIELKELNYDWVNSLTQVIGLILIVVKQSLKGIYEFLLFGIKFTQIVINSMNKAQELRQSKNVWKTSVKELKLEKENAENDKQKEECLQYEISKIVKAPGGFFEVEQVLDNVSKEFNDFLLTVTSYECPIDALIEYAESHTLSEIEQEIVELASENDSIYIRKGLPGMLFFDEAYYLVWQKIYQDSLGEYCDVKLGTILSFEDFLNVKKVIHLRAHPDLNKNVSNEEYVTVKHTLEYLEQELNIEN